MARFRLQYSFLKDNQIYESIHPFEPSYFIDFTVRVDFSSFRLISNFEVMPYNKMCYCKLCVHLSNLNKTREVKKLITFLSSLVHRNGVHLWMKSIPNCLLQFQAKTDFICYKYCIQISSTAKFSQINFVNVFRFINGFVREVVKLINFLLSFHEHYIPNLSQTEISTSYN